MAVALVERGLGGDAVDLADRVERLARDRSKRGEDANRMARGWAEAARSMSPATGAREPMGVGRLVALAYPDRIAKARGKPGEFLMANGRAAALEPHEALARAPYLAIAEISGRAASARILAAAALTLAEVEAAAGAAIETREETTFDRASASLRTRRAQRLGAMTLAERVLPTPAGPDSARALAEGIAALGIARLPWTKALSQWRDRVEFLRRQQGDVWPDLSDAALAANAAEWLAPHLEDKTALAEVSAETLGEALRALLPWDMLRRLDAEAPTHFEAPTGNSVALDYEAEGGPALAIRVQELFGLREHPSIAGGRAPLTLHLLSPAHRPIQITRDLPGFWKGSWSAVKTEMKGRYPRHVWPDDPANTAPTARAKPRGT